MTRRQYLCSLGAFLLAGPAHLAAQAPSTPAARLISSPEPGWPQFRGPRRDGISDERGLLHSWPEGGPKLLWAIQGCGQGFASPSISGGRIFITGDFGNGLRIQAFDLEGKFLWQNTHGAAWKDQYPGARSTPTFSEGRLYHQNAHGRLGCFDAGTGKEEWSLNVLERFGGENITWGLSECLVVDENTVYVTAGGKEATVVALEKRTGTVRWKSGPIVNSSGGKAVESAGYVSPILIEFAGRRLLIGCSLRHLYCIDVKDGQLQWTQPMPTSYSVLAMSPVLVSDGVFMTAPHGKGGRLFRLHGGIEGKKIGVEEVWTTSLDTCQGGAVTAKGKLFGSFYGRKGWAAVEAQTGKMLYQTSDIIKGAALYADERLYLLSENGWIRLIEPTETEFQIRGEFRLPVTGERSDDIWAHPVILSKRLYVRHHDELYCYSISRVPGL